MYVENLLFCSLQNDCATQALGLNAQMDSTWRSDIRVTTTQFDETLSADDSDAEMGCDLGPSTRIWIFLKTDIFPPFLPSIYM